MQLHGTVLELSKNWGPSLGVFVIGIVVDLGLFGGPLFVGNSQMHRPQSHSIFGYRGAWSQGGKVCCPYPASK